MMSISCSSSSPPQEKPEATMSQLILEHPLYPLLQMVFQKCELATSSPRDAQAETICSSDSFSEDIRNFISESRSRNLPLTTGVQDVDKFMLKSIEVLRIHLLELEKVHQLCDNFCQRYINCLKGKLPIDLVVDDGSSRDANSTASSVLNNSGSQSGRQQQDSSNNGSSTNNNNQQQQQQQNNTSSNNNSTNNNNGHHHTSGQQQPTPTLQHSSQQQHPQHQQQHPSHQQHLQHPAAGALHPASHQHHPQDASSLAAASNGYAAAAAAAAAGYANPYGPYAGQTASANSLHGPQHAAAAAGGYPTSSPADHHLNSTAASMKQQHEHHSTSTTTSNNNQTTTTNNNHHLRELTASSGSSSASSIKMEHEGAGNGANGAQYATEANVRSPTGSTAGSFMGDASLGSGDGTECEDDDNRARRQQKKRGIFPKAATNIMRAWLFQHLNHPYPSEDQKKQLAEETGLTILQVNNWFINARRRIVQPMIDQSNRTSGNIMAGPAYSPDAGMGYMLDGGQPFRSLPGVDSSGMGPLASHAAMTSAMGAYSAASAQQLSQYGRSQQHHAAMLGLSTPPTGPHMMGAHSTLPPHDYY